MFKKLTFAIVEAIATGMITTLGFTSELLGGALIAQAATPRSSWVQNEIYQYNHQFAGQLPNELATKMQKMSVSAFAFYRGTAHIFYKDLNSLPVSNFANIPTDSTWLSGDMHLMNMGVIRDSSGKSVFDTTDFDEGYLGSYIWDVRRMAVSILLAAKENGLSASDRQDVVKAFLDAYLDKMKEFKGTDKELTYSVDDSNTNGVVNDLIQKSTGQSRSSFLSKYTTINSSGKRLFLNTSELQAVSSLAYSAIASGMNGYIASISSSKRYGSSYYTLKDVRLKLGSGTGSLGRYRYFLLIEGASSSTSDDVILEMKQETTSTVAIAAPNRLPASTYNFNEAQRVAMSMKSMLSNTDPLVGYTNVGNISYFIREKSPYQVDFDYTLLTSQAKFTDAMVYQAKVLAKNHALSDKDYNPSIVPYSQDKEITDLAEPYRSAFKTDILNFALNYATQVEYDYNSFNSLYQNKATLY
jgi:uncharacterized protein (DUF2252 family)